MFLFLEEKTNKKAFKSHSKTLANWKKSISIRCMGCGIWGKGVLNYKL